MAMAAEGRFWKNDLLLSLVDRSIGLTGLRMALLVLVLFTGGTMLICAIEGTLLPGSVEGGTGFLDRRWIHNWTTIPVLLPLFFLVLVVAYQRMDTMIDALFDEGVLQGDRASFVRALNESIRNRRVDVVILIGTLAMLAVWGITVFFFRPDKNWITPNASGPSIASTYRMVMICAATYITARFAWTWAVVFFKLGFPYGGEARCEIAVKNLHPDGCGGLRAVGAFALWLVVLLAVLAMLGAGMIVMAAFGSGKSIVNHILDSPTTVAVCGAYLIAGPALFLITLIPTHLAMGRVKFATLLELANEHERQLDLTRSSLGKGDEVLPNLTTLEQVRKIYDQVRSMPTWPFNSSLLARLSGTLLLPVAIALLTELVRNVVSSMI